MVAIVLAAGYGTRLYPLTENTPKALLPVGERTLLGHLEKKLAAPEIGIRKAILVSNHRFAGKFQDWAKQPGHSLLWTVLDDGSTSDENRLGSMGDLAFAIKKEKVEDDLLVLGSDNLFEDGLTGLGEFTRGKGATTLGAYELPDRALATQYGVLSADAQKKITKFEEKPAKPESSLISTAAYFFPRKAVGVVLEYVSSKAATDKLGSFISWLVTREPVYAHRFRGRWFDIGDIASYKHAQETFRS
jgi:glucose-1-phosphate thymidylyltransferase